MKQKSFQFKVLEEWEDYQFGFKEAPTFNDLLIKSGQEGWQIVSVNYVAKKGKIYKAIWLQREIGS